MRKRTEETNKGKCVVQIGVYRLRIHALRERLKKLLVPDNNYLRRKCKITQEDEGRRRY